MSQLGILHVLATTLLMLQLFTAILTNFSQIQSVLIWLELCFSTKLQTNYYSFYLHRCIERHWALLSWFDHLDLIWYNTLQVWRNCTDDYVTPVSIWHPRPPEGFVSLGCVAVPCFAEPELDSVYCVAESVVEETTFEELKIWSAPDSYPWACHIYHVNSDALHIVALRQPKEECDWKPMRVIMDNPQQAILSSQVPWLPLIRRLFRSQINLLVIFANFFCSSCIGSKTGGCSLFFTNWENKPFFFSVLPFLKNTYGYFAVN